MIEPLQITNKIILEKLDEFLVKDFIDGTQYSKANFDHLPYDKVCESSTSDESLYRIINGQKKFTKYKQNNVFGETDAGVFLKDYVYKTLNPDIFATSSYVPKGFISWHTDCEVSGLYIIFSYSYGNNKFKALDNLNKTIVTIHDPINTWVLRTGYVGKNDHDKFWHCITTEDIRLTFICIYHDVKNYEKALETLGIPNSKNHK